MTVNFALSLSVEGIELLHRVSHEWQRLGRADIASKSLTADMAALRQKAAEIAPDGLITKLIIPDDQIKFTAIDSTQTTSDDIAAILEGATPYPLDALVIDAERSGGRTYIAAVARETLTEAEAFATAHGFHPVVFVAIAEPLTFQREVFFGPTRMMPDLLGADATVSGEQSPIVIADDRAARVPQTDFFARDPKPAVPAMQSIWVDAIPPEHHPPTAPVTAAPDTPLRTVALVQLALFDRIIPEVRPLAPQILSTPRAKSVLAAPIAPRKPPAAAKPMQLRPFAIAAGLGAVLIAGFYGWGQFPADDKTQSGITAEVSVPAVRVVAEPVIPAPALGPAIPDVATTGFDIVDAQAITAPSLAATTSTATRLAVPPALFVGSADAPPDAPQEPPVPPVEVAEAAPQVVADPSLQVGVVLSPDAAERAYAATGVWQRSPRFLDIPSGARALTFARPPARGTTVRVAQPVLTEPEPVPDFAFAAPGVPPAADVIFARDASGFVQATAEGAVTPNGAIVIAGLPDLNINLRPALTQAQRDRFAMLAPAPAGVVIIAGPPPTIPPLRPDDLRITVAPQPSPTEPTATPPTPGAVGLTSLELQSSGSIALDTAVVEDRAETDLRPQLRPNGLLASVDQGTPDITDILAGIAAEDATLRFDSSTPLAVRASVRPNQRPSNFSTVVAAAQIVPQTSTAPAAAAITAAAPVAPQNYAPVPGGVARAATIEDVIRLRDMNLIGVYGRPNARRALVRLSNGRYVRVEVGSALDGGQVTAIGDETLNYVKRGRTYAVELPSG
jgi:hypothetical protein